MINEHLISPWPPEVSQALARFRQGGVLEDPPLFYWGDNRHPLWRPTVDELDGDTEAVIALDEGTPSYGVITTQTCDLREGDRGQKRPWFSFAPAYLLNGDPDGIRAMIEQGRVSYLTRLTGLGQDAFWIADTRIECPVEKSWLVGRRQISGFVTQQEYLDFADKLAANRTRPALADAIYERVIKPLRDMTSAKGAEATAVFDPIWAIRLVIAGDHVAPDAVELVVLTRGDSPALVREWFEGWWEEAQGDANDVFALLRPRFINADSHEMTLVEYQGMVDVPLSDITPE